METASPIIPVTRDYVLSPLQVAETLNYDLRTLRRRWAEGKGPRRVRLSERRVGVLASDMEKYLASLCDEVV